jgi:uncharacterized protein with FMN-binding domain
MKRAPIVMLSTLAGTAGVLGFHAHSPAVQSASAAAATATSTPATATATSTPTSSSTSSTSGTKTVSGTATGDAVDTRYGPAQVKVTVKNGKIVSVEAVELQSNDPHSQMISSSAAPILRQEVLAKQTAAVDTVSGATYTSASYLQSLQSALDKLGYKAPDGSVATAQVPA